MTTTTRAALADAMTVAQAEAAALDSRIGVLCREGRPVFYFVNGDGRAVEHATAASAAKVLRNWDHLASAIERPEAPRLAPDASRLSPTQCEALRQASRPAPLQHELALARRHNELRPRTTSLPSTLCTALGGGRFALADTTGVSFVEPCEAMRQINEALASQIGVEA